MINPSQVDAVLVTKGDVDLQPIKNTLVSFKKIIICDNSKMLNMGPFGQFLLASMAYVSDVVYFQDDDCLTNPETIIQAWEPGKIVCNMGQQGHAANYINRIDKLMGFGSCFERSLIKPTFERYWRKYPIDRVTWREPGRIFTAMNHDKLKVVEVAFRNLPWAEGYDRLYRQPEHVEMGREAICRVREVLNEH